MQTFITDNGIQIAYQIDGIADAPALVFSNALGTDLHMWDEQVVALGRFFRIIRYDTRGHGQSANPTEPATIDRLGHDLVGLLDYLGIEHTHVCGLSLGGLTAQWLAATYPQQVDRAIFANTAARIGSFESWSTRISFVERGGMGAIRDTVLARLFRPAFRSQNPEIVQHYSALLDTSNPDGYIAACAALRDADLRPIVGAIRAPCLIITSTLDEATPAAQAEELQRAIAGSTLVVLEQAAHLSNVEQPEAFNVVLREFLGVA